ncbi:MAG: SBBP repeat-containing protein, partial [Verrucomicrobiota bacterium]
MRQYLFFVLFSVLLSATGLEAGTPPEFLWAKGTGGSSDDYGNAVAVDSVGNSVQAGSFTGTGSFLGTNLVSSGVDDIYLFKLNSNGALLWARRAGGSGSDEAYAVTLDSTGNAFVAGRFTGTAAFGSTNLVSAGTHDMFLAKYDVDGNFLWARRAGGTNTDYANGVSADANGNVFVTGVFSSAANFGGVTLTNAGNKDIFIAKYDGAGNFLWARRAGSTGTDVGFNVAADRFGNAYITGWFVFTANFGGANFTALGAQDAFLAKYDSAGNFLWLRQSGGSAAYDYGYSVAVDSAGNPHVSGSFRSTANFSGSSLTSSGSADIFLAKYSTNGTFLWAQKAGAPDASAPFKANDDEGYSVAVDGQGNAILTGYINGTANFSGTSISSISADQDIFIAKYSTNGTLSWVLRAGGSGGSDYGNSIALDANGNAYLTGAFYGAATFGTNNVTSVGLRDVYATKVSTMAVAATPPVISDVTDKILNEDAASGAIPFTVSDAETPAPNLIVAASASNSTLLPASSLVLGGSGGNRTLTITPPTN